MSFTNLLPLKTSIPEVFTGGGPYEPEAGTYKGNVSFGMLAENLYNVHTIKAPNVEKPETVHFILRVTDKGNPPLSRYQRVIVTLTPK
jgi:hypothetical protein